MIDIFEKTLYYKTLKSSDDGPFPFVDLQECKATAEAALSGFKWPEKHAALIHDKWMELKQSVKNGTHLLRQYRPKPEQNDSDPNVSFRSRV